MKLKGKKSKLGSSVAMPKKILQNLKRVKEHKNSHPESLNHSGDFEGDLHIEYAKILLSLWSYACNVDGKLKSGESELVSEMVNVLFEPNCLLSEYKDKRKEVLQILSKTFDEPLPMKTVTKAVIDNDQYALNFFEDAVCIVASDGTINQEEREFLDELALELQISLMDKHQVEKKYIS
ncbi:TerB family tellurite resistance protein [Leptospira ilyithenensis]|uniref:TerB family tellurite resistance protein n=2 Tax=Leptospira ilyithenensis TaxID=2484901 RepID=A0A4R9LSG5_9LEPT|nr:TerB family tellurite resistance protein [Leptospira ilyithenensis]